MRSSPLPDLLTAEALTVGYSSDHPVVAPLQLSVPPGQLICLLGPNGSGKSTLLRTLAGMQPPLSGQVQLSGQLLTQLTPAQRATQRAVVLTETPTASLTAYELVAMGRYPYTSWLGRLSADDRRVVDRAMQTTGTREFATRPVGTLSDGERQKVMIARAVAQDTPLLILDEPTAHLDVRHRTAVLRLLQRLAHDQPRAVLLSTHALDLALLMADRLWLLHEGQMFTGVPEDLVLDGTLARVFAQEGLRFDEYTGTFRVVHDGGRVIGLDGPMPATFWTRRALERAGYTVVASPSEVLSVRVTDGPPWRWVVRRADATIEVTTVAELLSQLVTD